MQTSALEFWVLIIQHGYDAAHVRAACDLVLTDPLADAGAIECTAAASGLSPVKLGRMVLAVKLWCVFQNDASNARLPRAQFNDLLRSDVYDLPSGWCEDD